jgi:hypothetical protein
LNDDPNKPAAGEGVGLPENALERAPASQPNLQSVLVASLIGAIILMIAIAAFWTSL